MSSNVLVGLLFYLVPLLILICICMCCTIVRENRRNRAANIPQQHVPISSTIINSVEQSSRENNSSPPPYTAEPCSNFDESLPSYERAINRLR